MSHLKWLKDNKIPRKRQLKSFTVKMFNPREHRRRNEETTTSTHHAVRGVNPSEYISSSSSWLEQQQQRPESKSIETQTEEEEERLVFTVEEIKTKSKRVKCFKCRAWNHTRAQCPTQSYKTARQEKETNPTSVWDRLGDLDQDKAAKSEKEERVATSYEDVLLLCTLGERLEGLDLMLIFVNNVYGTSRKPRRLLDIIKSLFQKKSVFIC